MHNKFLPVEMMILAVVTIEHVFNKTTVKAVVKAARKAIFNARVIFILSLI